MNENLNTSQDPSQLALQLGHPLTYGEEDQEPNIEYNTNTKATTNTNMTANTNTNTETNTH